MVLPPGQVNRSADDSLSLGVSDSGIELLERLVSSEQAGRAGSYQLERLTAKAGSRVVEAGRAFHELMLVSHGHLKTVFSDENGNEQVVGFPVRGDLLGTDGISDNCYINDVVTLTDVELLLIPFTDLHSLQLVHPGIVDSLFRIISQQLVQEQLALTAIGALSAESRVARFLLKLQSQREMQGEESGTLYLRMTRQDIGNYLGMKIETVSRTLSLLASQGLLDVSQRRIEILTRGGLEAVAFDGPLRTIQVPRKTVRPSKAKSASAGRTSSPATPWSGLLDLN
ncbi:MAG: Crp/Fnr family transcriptional regulator [Burkholderiaceae bacterium]